MRLREIAVSIAAGVAIFALVFTFPILARVVQAATDFWYLAAAVLLAAAILGRSRRWPEAARLLGVIGVMWGTLVIVPIAVLFFIVATGQWGY